jgi:hypothetical protein
LATLALGLSVCEPISVHNENDKVIIMNTIQQAMAAATTEGSFEENSTTDSHDIDHLVVEDAGIGENEELDFPKQAEKDEKHEVEAKRVDPNDFKAKSPTPAWVNMEFYWQDGVNKASGETTWYLRAHAWLVAQVLRDAPIVVGESYLHLSDTQKKLSFAMGDSLKTVNEDAALLDPFLETTASRAFANSAGQSGARAARNLIKAQEEVRMYKKADSGKRSTDFGVASAERAAMIKLALIQADPTIDVNYISGTYESFRIDAAKHQKMFMNPDEAKAAQTIDHDATGSIVAGMYGNKGTTDEAPTAERVPEQGLIAS